MHRNESFRDISDGCVYLSAALPPSASPFAVSASLASPLARARSSNRLQRHQLQSAPSPHTTATKQERLTLTPLRIPSKGRNPTAHYSKCFPSIRGEIEKLQLDMKPRRSLVIPPFPCSVCPSLSTHAPPRARVRVFVAHPSARTQRIDEVEDAAKKTNGQYVRNAKRKQTKGSMKRNESEENDGEKRNERSTKNGTNGGRRTSPRRF